MNIPRPTIGPGDVLIKIAGADRTELANDKTADRTYYVGMGCALITAATIGAVSMTSAIAIGFRLSVPSLSTFTIFAVWFLLLLGVDRWLVSEQVTGFAMDVADRDGEPVRHTTLDITLSWVRHAAIELLKIAPRAVVIVISSLLFSKFLMLAPFNPEIQDQLQSLRQQDTAHYQAEIEALTVQLRQQPQLTMTKVSDAQKALQQTFNDGQHAIRQAAAAEQKQLATLKSAGVICKTRPLYTSRYNAITGHYDWIRTGSEQVCPSQLQSVIDQYQATAAKYPQTQQQVDTQKKQIAEKLGLADAQRAFDQAPAMAKKQLAGLQDQTRDGVLARMRALATLVTKPTQPCPSKPTAQDFANNTACVTKYSPDAAQVQSLLRWLLFFLELLPLLVKFINALLPRRGYAWAMAARAAEARSDAITRIRKATLRQDTEFALARRQERVRLEQEGALEELLLREAARQEQHAGVRRLRNRFSIVRAARQTGPTPLADAVIDQASAPRRRGRKHRPVTPVPAQPGLGVIDSEEFLL